MDFLSDNTAGAAPQVLAALAECNRGQVPSYGADPWSERLDGAFGRHFECAVRAFPVATGTAANALALATLCPPYGAVFTHSDAHIVRDECGAVEAATSGARLVLVPGDGGLIEPAQLETALRHNPTNVHTPQPRVLSLTQPTEMGRCYRPEQLAALSAIAHRAGLHVHMDGARFGNAVARLECQPADITWRVGVDVLSFGATKNGTLGSEAVVFFNAELVRDFELRRKRAGHLFSKQRFLSAQLLAYLDESVWRRNAQRTNALAQRLAEAMRERLAVPVDTNALFVRLAADEAAALTTRGARFLDWGPEGSGLYRFVVSWSTADAEVDALCAAFATLPRPSRN